MKNRIWISVSIFMIIVSVPVNTHSAGDDTTVQPVLEPDQSSMGDLFEPCGFLNDFQSMYHFIIFANYLSGATDFTTMLQLSPGIVQRDGMWYVRGSAASENLFAFGNTAGLPVQDPLSGFLTADLIIDTLDAVTIRRGGLPAAYGGFLGGVFETHLGVGSNAWHGDARLRYVDSNLYADRNYHWYINSTDPVDIWEPSFTLRGPIIRDRLWLLAGYRNYRDNDETIARMFYFRHYRSEDEVTNVTTLDQGVRERLPFLKLDWLSESGRHGLSLWWNRSDRRQPDAVGPDHGTPEAFEDLREQSMQYQAEYRWAPSADFKLSAAIGVSITDEEITPDKQSLDPHDAPFYDDYWFHVNYNNGEIWSDDARERFRVNVTASQYIDTDGGGHDLEYGLEYQRLNRDFTNRTPGTYSYSISQIPVGESWEPDYYFEGYEAERTYLYFPGTAEATGDIASVFIDDEWRISDRFRIDLGVRYDWAELRNAAEHSRVPSWEWGRFDVSPYLDDDDWTARDTAPLRFDTMVAPRIRVSWNLSDRHTTELSAFYGRYYRAPDLSLVQMFQPWDRDNTFVYSQMYTGPPWTDMDRDGVPDQEYFFDRNNWYTQPPYPEPSNLVDPDLEPEYTDEFIVGLRHRFDRTWTGEINLIHRRTNDLIEDTGLFLDGDGNVIWTWQGAVNADGSGLVPGWDFDPGEYYGDHYVSYITNVPGNDREYNGLEFSATGAGSCWDMTASYTLSKAEGAALDPMVDEDGIHPFTRAYDSPTLSRNLYGELPWSARHVLRFAGAYRFDIADWYDLSLGLSAQWNSGYHYSKRRTPPQTYDPSSPHNDLDDPSTWTAVPVFADDYAWFPEGRGTYTMPAQSRFDLSIQNIFRIHPQHRLTLILDVLNLADNQETIEVDNTYQTRNPDLFARAIRRETPRSLELILKYAF